MFNFTQVPFRCVLGIPSNIPKLDFKKCVCKKDWFSKKNFTYWIRTHDLLNVSQLLYPLSYVHGCSFLWLMIFLHFFVFNRLLNTSWSPHQLVVTNVKYVDNGFMVLGSWYVDVSSPRRVIGITDRQVFSFIFIDIEHLATQQCLNFIMKL